MLMREHEISLIKVQARFKGETVGSLRVKIRQFVCHLWRGYYAKNYFLFSRIRGQVICHPKRSLKSSENLFNDIITVRFTNFDYIFT